MQGIENKTDLVGTILSRTPHPRLADYDILGVRVEDAKPVEGVADLLSSTVGSELAVTVRRALLDDAAQPGATIRSRAKRTPDGAMADTYPEAGAFEIRSASARATEPTGNPRSDDPRSDDPRSGEPRSGEPRSGEPRPGEPRPEAAEGSPAGRRSPGEPSHPPTGARAPRDPDD